MKDILIRQPQGFNDGYTPITHIGDEVNDTGINFGILKLKSGESKVINTSFESAYLLLQGKCHFACGDETYLAERQSCFDVDPSALHLPPNFVATITAESPCEFAVFEVENSRTFTPQIYHPANLLESEHRGKGLLNDTAYRLVRTIFDTRNSPHANLVLGEVITAPGRWSSYPPHHHDQPEMYHYRFTEPQGYGHSEFGDHVFKVQQYDTYKIMSGHDHGQVAAPGYGMYYIWVIRNLENNPYLTPDFTEIHSWTKSPDANERVWQENFSKKSETL